MKKFSYEAKEQASGQIIKATVQADSERSAAKALIAQGFNPLDIREVNEGGILQKLSGRIRAKDKIIFLRQLSTLIGAGLPLTQSLRTVLEQTENKKLQDVVQEIISDIEGGRALSDALAKHPEVFDKIVLALVSAGEASGTLDQALKRIANQKEKDAAMMSKIRGAMIYPAIVLVVILGVLLFMLLTVVPQVEKLYVDMRQELPFLTKMLIGSANFLINYWWVVIAVIVAGVYFGGQYLKTEGGVKMQDKLKLNLPMFSGMFRKLYMARFCRTGETLLVTGVPMLDMLKINAEGVNNTIIAEGVTRASEKVKSGKALSSSIKNEEYFLTMVPQMIKIGEQSGKIDEMMGKTAQVYEDELDEEIRAISTSIEPILMVVMALFAGVMVGAILFPIYSLVGNIR
ncbi:MAG TPA: type II secretion system F family protein [Candidatus Saccharibacteria bacterium]|nr:type II secretion system F family protein [Candidatus Saccharibacteria bacterium]HMR38531.1 type II secretion system F family protein [Candidatus Saccharibacteria bacterium]